MKILAFALICCIFLGVCSDEINIEDTSEDFTIEELYLNFQLENIDLLAEINEIQEELEGINTKLTEFRNQKKKTNDGAMIDESEVESKKAVKDGYFDLKPRKEILDYTPQQMKHMLVLRLKQQKAILKKQLKSRRDIYETKKTKFINNL